MLGRVFWANYFRVYDNLNSLRPYRDLIIDMSQALGVCEHDLVLDAGCGTGNLTAELIGSGTQVVGIDYSDVALQIFRIKNPAANAFEQDLRHPLNFNDDYFSCIACSNVLYTLPRASMVNLLGEFYRVLRPNGRLVISNQQSKEFSILRMFRHHINGLKGIKKVIAVFNFIRYFAPILPFDLLIRINLDHGKYEYLDEEELFNALKHAGFRKIDINPTYANQNFLAKGLK